MELAFATKMLRDICESEVLAYQLFDSGVAKTLIARLADLRAVEMVNQMPIGNPSCIVHDGEERIEVELNSDVKIVLSANHSINPVVSNSTIDWNKVSRIKICSIGEYDG